MDGFIGRGPIWPLRAGAVYFIWEIWEEEMEEGEEEGEEVEEEKKIRMSVNMSNCLFSDCHREPFVRRRTRLLTNQGNRDGSFFVTK